MNINQVSSSVEAHTEEPLWQEFTEEEQEKICGGRFRVVAYNSRTNTWRYATWRDFIPGAAPLAWAWNGVVIGLGVKVR